MPYDIHEYLDDIEPYDDEDDELEGEDRDPNDCAECARSYGPWYTGKV
jgi:hypothetical protein